MKRSKVVVGITSAVLGTALFVTGAGAYLTGAYDAIYTEGTVSINDMQPGDVVYPGVTITDAHCVEMETENDYYCSGMDQPWETDVTVQESYTGYYGTTISTNEGWIYYWNDSVYDPCTGFIAGGGQRPAPQTAQVTASNTGCDHDLQEWVYVSEVTLEEDAYMSQVCSKCGCLSTPVKGGDGRREASAYWLFGEVTRQMVLTADENATVEISTECWLSYSKEVMDALSERSDVTLVLTYKAKDGFHYQVEMNGTENLPLDSYYGFTSLSNYYPTTVVTE